jgi:hypothetical protein
MTGGSVVTVRDVKPSLRAEIVSSPIRLTRLFIIDDLISGYTHIGTSDLSFLRALMHQEYTTRQEEIALEHLYFMQENSEKELYTMFDFAGGSYCRAICRVTRAIRGSSLF